MTQHGMRERSELSFVNKVANLREWNEPIS